MLARPPLALSFLLLVTRITSAQTVEDPFALLELKTAGRTVAAEMGDFDGDGRADLLQIVFVGIPPDDKRVVRLWTQTSSTRLPAGRPWQKVPAASLYGN